MRFNYNAQLATRSIQNVMACFFSVFVFSVVIDRGNALLAFCRSATGSRSIVKIRFNYLIRLAIRFFMEVVSVFVMINRNSLIAF